MTVSKGRKVQRSITLDACIDAALPALREKLEKTSYPNDATEAQAIHGPASYNISNTIQIAIASLMLHMGIDPWKNAKE